jgi:hypothetical protein
MRISIVISQKFPVTVTLVLAALALFLTLMSVLGHISEYLVGEYLPGSVLERLVKEVLSGAFDLDHERSFPTLYSATMLLLCSVLLAGITLSRRAVHERYVWHWAFLSVIFVYLFADEILQIHEETITPLRSALGTGGFFYFAWVILALILLLILGLLYAEFVIDLPAAIQFLILTAAFLYVAGAVGLEMVGGSIASSYGLENSAGDPGYLSDARYIVITTTEEFLEMLGITVFIGTLLEYMRVYVEKIELRLRRKDL